jgi:hypothetical protein
MDKKNVLIFPAGSEVGFELNRSLKLSRHIKIWGGSSVDDSAMFRFENYIGGFPFIDDESFIPYLLNIIAEYEIDVIYPAMDRVIAILKENERSIGCKIITSSLSTVDVCFSKDKTYRTLKSSILTPQIFNCPEDVKYFPIFMKPNQGYGSRGAKLITSIDEMNVQLKEVPESIILEYLPGEEYTIDCFTNRKGELLFVGPRIRGRMRMGISVYTRTIEGQEKSEFLSIARSINSILNLRYAWFFQVKRNINNELVLLEIASRIGGSTGVFRAKGINLPLLSFWDSFEEDVEIISNDSVVKMDRILDCISNIDSIFDKVYVDFDDTLIINNRVNVELVKQPEFNQ